MNIELDIVQSIYDDATLQLAKHGKTLEEKTEDIIEEYALEHRRLTAKADIVADVEQRVSRTDFRKTRNIEIVEKPVIAEGK